MPPANQHRIIWKRGSALESEPLFRLFFETYGIGLGYPQLYKAFLHDTIKAWLRLTTDELGGERHQRKQARVIAAIVLAGLRGFMLDFCTPHDRQRVDQALGLWLHSLDSMLTMPGRPL
jgi:hypothetical protein